MARPIVSMINVEKWFGGNHVIKNCNLNIMEGEFLTLLGPSGCGKTTTLRMISGFEQPTSGMIRVEGENIEDKEPYERDVNTVFQNYALFPNMNVFDNIAYGLRVKKVAKAEIAERVRNMLRLVQLEGFEKRRIHQMSGGQKQRVAIARALINRPKVLLLDEPLGALDLKLRKQMQIELKRLQRKLGITFVYVTHDQEEALTMSDRIAVINGGVIEQIDVPQQIYDHPATRFVADFIGESNILDAVVRDQEDGLISIGTEIGTALGISESGTLEKGDAVSIAVRPEDTLFSTEKQPGFSIRGVVKDHVFVGNLIKMMVTLNNGKEMKINRFGEKDLVEPGKVIYLYWEPEKGKILKTQNLIHTDSLKDLERGGEKDEKG
ncbi:ABC transporter ATP-binding protein [Pseudoramibacter sp.]|jgi:spermidine/putrescine transport system ATP-binding protein|uniref:ABC transporter ATP-binding protein n=1 Tax=Pseudoramibacter sp. TaxID=2034862 RepID=UPI0025E109DC|nr:ABC transporter ATP-binding protein [Pseudoramibacter sp.]MCH4072294.1 ABC transporter ATP-binding protein [Pseudoramibacter sp.]MCH4106065.1 ABC transporter ATP-binding protein [Pseudoramibacter sp.]